MQISSKFMQFSCLSLLSFRCHEMVVIIVGAINWQYLHTTHVFHNQIYMIVDYLKQSHVCIMKLATVDNLIRL